MSTIKIHSNNERSGWSQCTNFPWKNWKYWRKNNAQIRCVLDSSSYLRIFLAGWLNQVRTLFCQSLWKWGFKIIPFRLGAMAAYFPAKIAKPHGCDHTLLPAHHVNQRSAWDANLGVNQLITNWKAIKSHITWVIHLATLATYTWILFEEFWH